MTTYNHKSAAINKQGRTSYVLCRAEDSKPQYTEVLRMTAPCITESPLSQLRQTLELRTTVSEHSFLVSTQHASTENELRLALS